jgi:hypothetical protein
VRIKRPIEDVFALVLGPLQFPRWNSAVRTVQLTSGRTGELGSTYSMERELPTGQAENELEVFARDHPSEFGIRTTSGPTPFVYRYRFASERGATVVRLDAKVELPGIAAVRSARSQLSRLRRKCWSITSGVAPEVPKRRNAKRTSPASTNRVSAV